jgi:hypothetical protein
MDHGRTNVLGDGAWDSRSVLLFLRSGFATNFFVKGSPSISNYLYSIIVFLSKLSPKYARCHYRGGNDLIGLISKWIFLDGNLR